jgi:hypothetical protein
MKEKLIQPERVTERVRAIQEGLYGFLLDEVINVAEPPELFRLKCASHR